MVEDKAKAEGARAVVISARIEEEVAQLPAEERADFLDSLGLDEPGLNRLIRAGYDLLGCSPSSPWARRKPMPGR